MGDVTHIEGPGGDLLWAPDSIDGKYTVKAAESVADVLRDLMQDIVIKAQIEIDEDSLANVYTKTESDSRFVLVTNFDPLLAAKISELINAGEIIGKGDLNTVNSRLLSLFISCYGTNFDGEKVSNESFNQLISNLQDEYSSQYTIINRLLKALYGERPDGSVDWSDEKYALVSDTGIKTNLSSYFTGSSRDNIVSAVNYTASQISSRDSIIGNSVLQTTAQTLTGAVNELLGLHNQSTQSIATISGSLASVSSSVTNLTESIADTKSSYNAMNLRVTNIETLDGSETLSTTKNTLTGAINEVNQKASNNSNDIGVLRSNITDINSDISSMKTDLRLVNSDVGVLGSDITNINSDINNIKSDISLISSDLSGVVSNIGDLSSLDSQVADTDIVKAINNIVSLLGNINSRIDGIEQRVQDLENRV